MNKKEIADRIFGRAEANQKPSSLFDTTNRIAELELQINENPNLSTREVFEARLDLEFAKKELTKQEKK
jgi:hypothetical protein